MCLRWTRAKINLKLAKEKETSSCSKPFSSGCVRGIDWVICMCYRRCWNVSRNMYWWMCLWLGSACEGYRVDAGNALTASRLPGWHQNRWMPLIVTVSNVLSSIIPSLSLFPCNISLIHSWRQLAKSPSCTVHSEPAVKIVILLVILGEIQHLILSATTKKKRLLRYMLGHFVLNAELHRETRVLTLFFRNINGSR